MLGVIRPHTYHANMRPLQSEFYDFCEREDEAAASLIAKSIRKLLRKGPTLLARKSERLASESSCSSGGSCSEWQDLISDSSDERLFHSDSSISSNCSSLSSDSSSSYSAFSSRFSLSERSMKKKEKHVEAVLPADMMNRLVRDIVRMAEGEPHGIRGCQLQIELEDSETEVSVSLGKINCDPRIIPNCLLRVHLVSIPPPPEAHGSQVLLNRLLGSSTYNIYIKPGYTIEKRRK